MGQLHLLFTPVQHSFERFAHFTALLIGAIRRRNTGGLLDLQIVVPESCFALEVV